MDNNIISIGIEIVFKKKGEDKNLKAERYRAKSNLFNNVKDLLKEEIDNIDKKYHFYNIISVKFTG